MIQVKNDIVNRQVIQRVLGSAYARGISFYCQYTKNNEVKELILQAVNITDTNVFFCYELNDSFEVFEGQNIQIVFTVAVKNAVMPYALNVRVLRARIHKHKMFFAVNMPEKLEFMQRRYHTRYPVKKSLFSHLSVLFTNTLFIFKDEWKELNNDCIIYNDISAGGMKFQISLDYYDGETIREDATIILRCGFNMDNNLLAFIIKGKICSYEKSKDNTVTIRVQFTDWASDEKNPHWRKIFFNNGIEPLAKALFSQSYKKKMLV